MTTALRTWEQALADEAAGLVYRRPLGPAVPGLNTDGLGYIRDDLLARAAGAEKQALGAWEVGNMGLVQRCEGAAHACRDAARQIVTYALMPNWMVTE